jgi:DNA helicase-2/ATP-dependent DNA helicase PcrA
MELQVELSKRGIPFVVRSGVRFFEQSHIKDVLSFLKYVFNPRDELAFFRILRTADGIGKRLGARLWSGLSRHESPTEGWHSDAVADSLPKRASRSWDRLRRQLIVLRHMTASDERPDKIIDHVVEGGYRSYIRKTFENFDNRLSDLTQLGNFAAQHDNLEAFLNEVLLQSSIEGEDVIEGGEADERLVLSTIHQAKGLEFRAVFVIWAADGHFPNPRAEDEGNLQEERRLFYVATTRAKNELYLCHPVRARDRERRMTIVRRSPFVDEIASDHYEEWVLRRETAR